MIDKDELEAMHVLLVEDTPDDLEQALRNGQISNRLLLAEDGQEALDILDRLRSRGEIPSMIVLDLNLPKVNGIEVLEKIKSDANLRRIPVIMLTTSTREEDVVPTYDLGVNTFISKPVPFEDFVQVVTRVQEYGICVATLPKTMGV